MKSTIVVKNLKKSFKDFVIDIPALEIPKGYITGFIGRNGAGKTTTIKLLLDILPPDSGEITIFGEHLWENPRALKERIGLVGEMTGYVEQCKVHQVKRMIAPFYPNWDETLYHSLLKRFSIPEDKRLNQLSKGQGKILSLVMVLSRHPKLLILDEPTANLDPVVRAEILEMLGELMLDEEMTILYSTHITSDLEHAGDYIVAIDNGRIQFTSEKDVLLDTYCLVQGDNALITPKTANLFRGLQQTSTGFRGLCSDRKAAEETFGREAIYQRPNIEDIMVYLAREEHGAL